MKEPKVTDTTLLQITEDIPLFRIRPLKQTKKAKEKAKIMDMIFQHLVPPTKQTQLYKKAVLHVLTCGSPDHKMCQGFIEYKWEEKE